MSTNKKKNSQSNGELVLKTTLDKKTIKVCFKFINEDAIDTYNHMVKRKWNKLPKEKRSIVSKEDYLSNTNIAISLLQATNNAFIEALKDLIKKAKSNSKKMKYITLEDI